MEPIYMDDWMWEIEKDYDIDKLIDGLYNRPQQKTELTYLRYALPKNKKKNSNQLFQYRKEVKNR